MTVADSSNRVFCGRCPGSCSAPQVPGQVLPDAGQLAGDFGGRPAVQPRPSRAGHPTGGPHLLCLQSPHALLLHSR